LIALIDGDIVAFRCAASCEPNKEKLEREPLDVAIKRADELMYRIVNDVGAEEYRVYLSSGENFRHQLEPSYKSNRKDKRRPEYLDAVREFLLEEWKASLCIGYEPDDALSIDSRELDNAVICSIDKDLLQVPGLHYNFVKSEFIEIDEDTANRNFWYQMLVGDSSDGIKGAEGIGPVKASRILSSASPNDSYESTVLSYYSEPSVFHRTKVLLRLLRTTDELKAIEATISESERQKSSEDSSEEDLGDVSGADKQ